MNMEPLGDEPQEVNVIDNPWPQWGPIIPVLHLLPKRPREFLAVLVDPVSVCMGGAEFVTGRKNIGVVLGSGCTRAVSNTMLDVEFPAYRPNRERFSGRGQVASPLSQLLKYVSAKMPNRLLTLGVGVNW